MNKLRLIVLLLLVAGCLSGIKAQNVAERKIDPFRKIRVSRAIDVYLKAGDKEQVSIETEGISSEGVITDVTGDQLKIQLDNGHYRDYNVRVYVTYVVIEAVTASAASGVFSEDTIKGNRFYINVSSAADVELSIDMKHITASVSSSGHLELKGETEYLDVKSSSAGDVDAFDLQAENVKVAASSAGGAKVTANKQINAGATSGGSIRYRGNP
ncbi:MAG: head GIN domain-containing protein, partial [Fulvivirga sp.]